MSVCPVLMATVPVYNMCLFNNKFSHINPCFVSPAKQKRDICIAFPVLSSSSAAA